MSFRGRAVTQASATRGRSAKSREIDLLAGLGSEVPGENESVVRSQIVPKRARAEHVRIGMLSGIAGYVDAVGFATLLGLFPAHLTGELVEAVVAVAHGEASSKAVRIAMIPIFVAAVVVAALVSRVFRRRGQAPLAPLLALMTAALTLFTVTGAAFPMLVGTSPSIALFLAGGSAVAAMGFQNAFMRQAAVGSCPTTMMTGNLTQLVIELVELGLGKPREQAAFADAFERRDPRRLRMVATALVGFLSGAMLGAVLTAKIGLFSIAVPAACAGLLTVLAYRDAQRVASR
nr:MAG: DUF1275 domain-containing protein [Pseudomonadota bacterium]